MNSIGPNSSHDRGVAIVEFCIVSPLLIIFFLFISQFGVFASNYLTLTRAVHEGVMRGIRTSPLAIGTDITPGHDAIKQRVQNTIDMYTGFGKLSGIDLSSLEIHVDVPTATSPRHGTVRVMVQARTAHGWVFPSTFKVEGVGDVIR